MTADWKAGDVALIPFSRGGVRAMYTGDGWVACDRTPVRAVADYIDMRRLVVIDAESREQVERLEALMAAHNGWTLPHNAPRVGYMQAALREFANPTPPKPDEPLGLGAVVRYDGSRWVGLDKHRWLEIPEDSCVEPRRLRWNEIRGPVEVIQQGVTP